VASGGNPLAATEITVPLNFVTHMAGEFETPPHDTRAKGQVTFHISPDRQSITYRLVATGIDNVIASHIHHGSVGNPGPAMVFLYGAAPPGGGRHNGLLAEGTLTAANLIGPMAGHPMSDLIDLIESGETYVNIHTDDGVAPGGTGPGD
jgi:hypothetical protein